jgi:hypothetical protein
MARPQMMEPDYFAGPGEDYRGGAGGGVGGGTFVSRPTSSSVAPSDVLRPAGGRTGRGMAPGTNYFPIGSQTLDQPMFPWLMPYQGQFTEPMSPYEMQGLGGISEYVGGGMGLGPSEDYLSDVIGGRYLDPKTNRWLAGIQSGAQSLKDIEDAQARRRIGSSMAAGGLALSGARLGAEQDYQNESDARFQQMISQLMSDQYARERGLQQGAIPLRAGLSEQLLLGQAERNAQYGDWLRQVSGMEEAYQYPDRLAQSTLGRGYPGSYQPQFGTSEFAGLLGLLSPLLDKLLKPKEQKPGGAAGSPGGGGTTPPGTRPGKTDETPPGGYTGPGEIYGEPIGPNPDWGYWGDPFADEGSIYGSTWEDIWGGGGGWQDPEGGIHSGEGDFLGSDIGWTEGGWGGGNEFENYGGYENWDPGWLTGGGDEYSDYGGMNLGGFDWGL